MPERHHVPSSGARAMRRLLLLRHAAAERAGPGESDQARPLSAEGQADAAAVGAYLGSHSLDRKSVV